MLRGNTAVVVGSHQVARKEPRERDEQLHEVVYTLVPASGCLAGCIEVVMIDHQSVFARRRHHVGRCEPACLPRWDRAMGSCCDTLLDLAQHKVQRVSRHQLGCVCIRSGRTTKPVNLDAVIDPRAHLAAGADGSPKYCCCPHTSCVKKSDVWSVKGGSASREVRDTIGGGAQDSVLQPPARPQGPHWLAAMGATPLAAAPPWSQCQPPLFFGARARAVLRPRSGLGD